MHTSPDLLALMALGETAGEPDDRRHVDGCPVCRAEVADLSRVATIGRSIGAGDVLITPRAEVWDAVRAELGFGDDVVTPISAARSSSRPRRLLALAVAAGLALIAGIGIGLSLERWGQSPETVISRANLVGLPAWSGASGQAYVERDGAGNRTLVIVINSPRPADASREVWLIDRDVKQMSSLGYLSDGRGTFSIPDGLSLAKFPIVDVSAEPNADPDPLHSGNSIVRGTLNPT